MGGSDSELVCANADASEKASANTLNLIRFSIIIINLIWQPTARLATARAYALPRLVDSNNISTHRSYGLVCLHDDMNCQRGRKQQGSKLAGVEFHGLKLTQAGPEGLSLFLTIAATAAALGEWVAPHNSNCTTISF
jgi:hypothetical protein